MRCEFFYKKNRRISFEIRVRAHYDTYFGFKLIRLLCHITMLASSIMWLNSREYSRTDDDIKTARQRHSGWYRHRAKFPYTLEAHSTVRTLVSYTACRVCVCAPLRDSHAVYATHYSVSQSVNQSVVPIRLVNRCLPLALDHSIEKRSREHTRI